MTRMIQIAFLLCMLLFVCLVLFFPSADIASSRIAYADTEKAARLSAPDGFKDPSYTLFPDLRGIIVLTLKTPDRSFQFRRDSAGGVCVNGQQADSGIYNTLVGQITHLPVATQDAFDPDGAKLLLTLEITDEHSKHTAHFYTDGAAGEMARIVSGPPDAPQYHRTDGWRVGTLMMTCEGTRIQDERGNEIPAILIN